MAKRNVSTHSAMLIADSAGFESGMTAAIKSMEKFRVESKKTKRTLRELGDVLGGTPGRLIGGLGRGRGIGIGKGAVAAVGALSKAAQLARDFQVAMAKGEKTWADLPMHIYQAIPPLKILADGTEAAYNFFADIFGTDLSKRQAEQKKWHEDQARELARQAEERKKQAEEEKRIQQQRDEETEAYRRQVDKENAAIKKQIEFVRDLEHETAKLGKTKEEQFKMDLERMELAPKLEERALEAFRKREAFEKAAERKDSPTVAAALAGTVAAYSMGQQANLEKQNLTEQVKHTRLLEEIANGTRDIGVI